MSPGLNSADLLACAMLLYITVSKVACAPDADFVLEDEWDAFKLRFNKSYDGDVEENFRKSVYFDNRRKIDEHNEKYELGLYTYKIRINQFGDMLFEEYENYMHPADEPVSFDQIRRIPRGERFARSNDSLPVPDSVDWRDRGAVSPVQDQGFTCGACWAFAAAGALEGQYWKKSGQLTRLSAQSLVDCSGPWGNLGCGGGHAVFSYQYAADRAGLEPEANYAYRGRAAPCQSAAEEESGSESSGDDALGLQEEALSVYSYVERADEESLKLAVAAVGPLSAAIDGSHNTFRFYSEGIYYQPECDETDLDHAVLIVGYGSDANNRDFWLVKNSWGEAWGEAGYFKIARNRHNHCGIAAEATYPLV